MFANGFKVFITVSLNSLRCCIMSVYSAAPADRAKKKKKKK